MTLYKQLIIMIIVLFLGLLLSVFYISANNLRGYINTQLSSHAQDAATSLGIALSSKMADKDFAAVETYVNAMFDSGYYRKIEILDTDEQVFFLKQRKLTEMEDVPDWIFKLFPLETPEEKADVMDGWSLAGTIKIISFPEFAYHNLWDNMKSIFNLFALTLLGLFLLSSVVLRVLLKPLSEIEQQAKSISNRQFVTIDINPVTSEFKRVVEAMNKMSSKLKNIFSEQAALTEELQAKAFKDEVTGLSNRSVFMKQLKYITQSEDYRCQGCLLMMQILDLAQMNKKYGHLVGNQLLMAVGQLFHKLSEHYAQSFVARISGTEFAIIIRSISPDKLNSLGKTLHEMLETIASEISDENPGFNSSDIAHTGIILTYPEQSMGAMLSEVDMALRLAQQKGINAYHIYDEKKEGMTVYGSSQWHDIITESINKNYFELHFQTVVDSFSQVHQKEAMLRLRYNGQLISAGIFIPMAEYLGITHSIDKWVIRHVFDNIKTQNNGEIIYSVNLSQDSLRDKEFSFWLKQKLEQLSSQQQKRIIFEIPEYHVSKYFSEFKSFINALDNFTCQFCIDHFGIGFSNMNYLKDVNVDFIKLHGSFAADIQETTDVSNYIRQVVTMAHSLDIIVISEGIENEKELEILKNLKVDLFQGYYIGRPEQENKLN